MNRLGRDIGFRLNSVPANRIFSVSCLPWRLVMKVSGNWYVRKRQRLDGVGANRSINSGKRVSKPKAVMARRASLSLQKRWLALVAERLARQTIRSALSIISLTRHV